MILRRLVLKSKLDFGVHNGKTVEEIFKNMTGVDYIRWLYFNASHIDLTDEIFKLVEIDQLHKISKPGKSPEMFTEHYWDKSKMKVMFSIKYFKKNGANYMIKKKPGFSKTQLRNHNQHFIK